MLIPTSELPAFINRVSPAGMERRPDFYKTVQYLTPGRHTPSDRTAKRIAAQVRGLRAR